MTLVEAVQTPLYTNALFHASGKRIRELPITATSCAVVRRVWERYVRLELAAVYRKFDAREIESQDGSRRAYVLKTIGDIIELAELERGLPSLRSATRGHIALQPFHRER